MVEQHPHLALAFVVGITLAGLVVGVILLVRLLCLSRYATFDSVIWRKVAENDKVVMMEQVNEGWIGNRYAVPVEVAAGVITAATPFARIEAKRRAEHEATVQAELAAGVRGRPYDFEHRRYGIPH